jgi:hypothetical protein
VSHLRVLTRPGNLGCAFIELLVAHSHDSEEYEALVAPIAVMSYSESKANTPAARSKSYTFSLKDKLKAKVAQQHWTKLRVVCKQTFNTSHAIGLAYVRINGKGTTATNTSTTASAGTKASVTSHAVPASQHATLGEEEESAAALFAKIRPATTFAQLKAQLASDALAKSAKDKNSGTGGTKSASTNTNSNTEHSTNNTNNTNTNSNNSNTINNTKNGNSAVRSNPFGDAVKTSQSVKPSAEPKGVKSSTETKSVKPSAAPKSVTGTKKSVAVDTSKNGQVSAKKTPLNKVLVRVRGASRRLTGVRKAW